MAPDAITDGLSIRYAPEGCPAIPDRRALSAIRLLFDRDFYLSHYPDVAVGGIDPLDHFLSTGLAEGRSPTPLFDPDFYRRQLGAPAENGVFLHYLTAGIRAGLDPHPLVDAVFYLAQAPALPADTNPLVHMLSPGRRVHRRPNPLFDPAYYGRRLRSGACGPHPLMHYALRGWRERLQPHPLFDPAAYLEQRPDIAAAGIDPLAHYLHQGRHEGVRPHWLFDSAHYAATCGSALAPEDAPLHFAAATAAAGSRRGSPNPLFDPAHYLRQHPDLATSGAEPFLHFLEFGLAENRDPHPLFDTWFYRRENPDVADTDAVPFVHYVRYGAREGRDPNAFFPARRYLERHPEARHEPAGPLAHFLRVPDTHLEPLCDGFDPAYYLACHPACAEAAARGGTPLGHYLSVGRAAGLSPRPLPIHRHPWQGAAAAPAPAATDPAPVHVLVVVPDASRCWPAWRALAATECLAADPALRCRVVAGQDGPLAERFACLAPTLVAGPEPAPAAAAAPDRVADVLHSFRDSCPGGIILLAGAAMPEVAALAARLGLRLVAWLHETPVVIDSLLGGQPAMRALARAAALIVTGSEAARSALLRHYALPPELVASLPDGIAPPCADDPRAAAARLRHSLGLPPDALLVMGGGPVCFAGGTDLFIRVAALVAARAPLEAPSGSALHQACFVWTGESPDPLFDALCRRDIDRLGLSARIRLLGPQEEADRMLAGADMFLQTDREPAGSGAGHLARGLGLPVIRFEEEQDGAASDAPDGLVDVPYLDLVAMADAVLARNRPARRLRSASRAAPQGSGWADWHQGMRGLLAQACGVALPPIVPATGSDRAATPAGWMIEAQPASPSSWPDGLLPAGLLPARPRQAAAATAG